MHSPGRPSFQTALFADAAINAEFGAKHCLHDILKNKSHTHTSHAPNTPIKLFSRMPCSQYFGGFSFASLSTAIVFSIAAIRVAGNAALLESGMLRGLYVITMPAIATVAPLIVELWLESLPSQVGHTLLHQPNNVVKLVQGATANRIVNLPPARQTYPTTNRMYEETIVRVRRVLTILL